MFNHAGAYVGMQLLKKFPPSFIIDLVSPIYEELCKENNFIPNIQYFLLLEKNTKIKNFIKRV